jgi:ubiquinone/menaquinone biosynthesis C-methylase UbiE
MKLIEKIHGNHIEGRRAWALSDRLAQILPHGFRILDVGCGDGLIASLIREKRSDIQLRGMDVLVRERTHIPVERFNGKTIPYKDDSFDGVMFVDVLHHTRDPMTLLREATRVARKTVVIKDHTLDGVLAKLTLRAMDWIGNARYGVSLPYHYWTKQQWLDAFAELGVEIDTWTGRLALYPWPAGYLFDRSLHFVVRLDVSHPRTAIRQ